MRITENTKMIDVILPSGCAPSGGDRHVDLCHDTNFV